MRTIRLHAPRRPRGPSSIYRPLSASNSQHRWSALGQVGILWLYAWPILSAASISAVPDSGANYNSTYRKLRTIFGQPLNQTVSDKDNLVFYSNCKLERGDHAVHWCIDIPRDPSDTNEDTAARLVAKIRQTYPDIHESWLNEIKLEVTNNFDKYANQLRIGFSLIGARIKMYSVGIVVDNIYNIDYIHGSFDVDMNIYLRKITHKYPTLNDALIRGFRNRSQARVVGFDNEFGETFLELLDVDYSEVEHQPRYGGAKVVPSGCSSDHRDHQTRLLTQEEYVGFGSGIQIKRFNGIDPKPIYGENNELLYIRVRNGKILFEPLNRDFYPFQVDQLSIELFFPRNPNMTRTLLCADYEHTGLAMPMEGLTRKGKENRVRVRAESLEETDEDSMYINIVPYINEMPAPPFLGKDLSHLRNRYREFDKTLNNGNKMVFAASFRIIYFPQRIEGFWIITPYLVNIVTTQLQWLVATPDNEGSYSGMVAAILLMQNVVTSSKGNLLFDNIASGVIFLSYAIVGLYTLTIATMTFINNSKEHHGDFPKLVKHRNTIFAYMRLITILSTLSLVPILVYQTDEKTGEQTHNKRLWFFVVFTILGILCIHAFLDFRRKKMAKIKDLEELERKIKDGPDPYIDEDGPTSSWTVEHVGRWIAELKGTSLTKSELQSVSGKFVKAGINGVVFPEVCCDKTLLMKVLGLTVGEAVLFVQTLEKMKAISHDTESRQPR